MLDGAETEREGEGEEQCDRNCQVVRPPAPLGKVLEKIAHFWRTGQGWSLLFGREQAKKIVAQKLRTMKEANYHQGLVDQRATISMSLVGPP